jgi:hypothetical protein
MPPHDHELWKQLMDELDLAQSRLAAARSERDAVVCRALAAGLSAREVGQGVGLSHVAVMNIRRRSNEED